MSFIQSSTLALITTPTPLSYSEIRLLYPCPSNVDRACCVLAIHDAGFAAALIVQASCHICAPGLKCRGVSAETYTDSATPYGVLGTGAGPGTEAVTLGMTMLPTAMATSLVPVACCSLRPVTAVGRAIIICPLFQTKCGGA